MFLRTMSSGQFRFAEEIEHVHTAWNVGATGKLNLWVLGSADKDKDHAALENAPDYSWRMASVPDKIKNVDVPVRKMDGLVNRREKEMLLCTIDEVVGHNRPINDFYLRPSDFYGHAFNHGRAYVNSLRGARTPI